MKNMKNLFLLLLVSFSSLLAACGTSSDSDPGDGSKADSATDSNEESCFKFISREEFKKILGEEIDLKVSSYNADSCKFETVADIETEKNMILIDLKKNLNKDWFLEKKQEQSSEESYTVISGVNDDAYTYFEFGWMKTRILTGSTVWFLESYIGSKISIPELGNSYSPENQNKIVAKKIEIAKQLAIAFKSN